MPADPETKAVIENVANALFAELATKNWHMVQMADVAVASDMSLAELRDIADSRLSILAKFAKQIDTQVLEEIDEDLSDEPARERIFDILMTRLDNLEPYKQGIRSLVSQVRRDPLLALELNRIACTSQSWMLSGAAVNTSGIMGMARTQGLVLAFSHVLKTWVDDDDTGLAITMAELDKTLRQGETHLSRLERVVGLFEPRTRRRAEPETPTETAAESA